MYNPSLTPPMSPVIFRPKRRNFLPRTEQNPFSRATQNISNLLLRKIEFGKSEPPVSDVHDIKRLTALGDSVCRLVIGNQVMGTGFVLHHKLILTNAHLFRKIPLTLEEDWLWTPTVPVLAQFYYEDRTLRRPPVSFEVELIADIDFEMDYAVLELRVEPGEIVPPGLLKHVGPKPESGGICIIGHPGGDVKKMDFTSIIGKYERVESANRKLLPYDDFTQHLITAQVYERPDVDQIFSSDQVITYDTFMFHGSSGSPVFDSECRLVGLHSDGFSYGFNEPKNLSIVEFGLPILDIFKKFVVNIAVRHPHVLLEDYKKVAEGNLEVIRILQETGLWIE